MHVSHRSGIGPDLELGPVGADAGEAERGGNVHVGGKAAGTVAGGAREDAQRRREPGERDVVLYQVGCAFEALRRDASYLVKI